MEINFFSCEGDPLNGEGEREQTLLSNTLSYCLLLSLR